MGLNPLKLVGTVIGVAAVVTTRVVTGTFEAACQGARPLVGDKVCDVATGISKGIDDTVSGIANRKRRG